MARGLLIQTNGDSEFRDIVEYTDIIEAVKGDFDYTAPRFVTYYCYEYALYEREQNPLATILYQASHPTKDVLCGPVLVMGGPENGEDTDVPEKFVQAFAELREKMSREEIDRLAVPLTPEQVTEIQTQTIIAQNMATKALSEGSSVDFGGVIINPGQVHLDTIDGQHREEN